MLRQRTWEPYAIVIIGAFSLWISVALRDAVSPASFPCILAGFFDYMYIPLMAGGLLLRLIINDNRRLVQELRTKNVGVRESQMLVDADLGSFMAYVRARTCNAHNETNDYQALVFAASQAHIVLWITLACSPFVCGFVVSLAARVEWQHDCSGCGLGTPEAIYLILIGTLIFLVGLHKRQKVKMYPDPLHLVREFTIASSLFYCVNTLSLILYLIDPGGVSSSLAVFDWRWISLLGALLTVYFVSVHRAIALKNSHGSTLTSRNFDEMDRFFDLKGNKELFSLFREHMKKELSDEALNFVLDVDKWKEQFTRQKEGRQRASRIIYDTYIVRKAVQEINIPSRMRDTLARDFNRGNVSMSVFDTAYKECVHLLMTDSLPRFIASPVYQALAAAKEGRSSVAPPSRFQSHAQSLHSSNHAVAVQP